MPAQDIAPQTVQPAGLLTQKQIAERLGVSRQLVSFALRGQGRMSDQVRAQILELAQHSGYNEYSNREARAMISRRYGKRAASGILAVVFQTTFQGQPVTSLPFFTAFFEGLEGEAIARGLDMALCALRPDSLPRLVRDGQVDGVIGLLTPDTLSKEVSALGLPIVNIMNAVSGAANLIIDEVAGCRLATQHLLELGHCNIAFIGLEGVPGRERLHGFETALQEYSLMSEARNIEVSSTVPSAESGAEAMQRILEKDRAPKSTLGFTGLVCHNDLMAMGAIRVLNEKGYHVPEDVSVVGFDDVSLQYSFQPALTSLTFPRAAMGKRAIDLLSEINNAPALIEREERNELFPVELVLRDSTQAPKQSRV